MQSGEAGNKQLNEGALEELASAAQRPPLDLRLVLAMAGDRPMNEREKQQVEKITQERGEGLFTDLLYTLTRRQFPSRQAKTLWGEIGDHRTLMKKLLGRDPGVAVATHDYLSNVSRLAHNLGMIEEQKLRTLTAAASRDGLTGLYDKATFTRLLREELARQARRKRVCVLVLADIDNFKKLNDTFGHADGDVVLQQVAEILQQQARVTDTVGRFGGEEFGIVMPEESLEAGRVGAERMRAAVEKAFAATPYKVTVSFGVALAQPGGDMDLLVRAADGALYAAKRGGRNRVEIAK